MKKGFFFNWIFGNRNKKDFDSGNLPQNRFGQFCYVFRSRFGVLTQANLLCALFVLPLCVWDSICGWFIADFVKDMTVAQQMSVLLNLSLLRYGTDAILCALAAVGLGGMYYVVRRLCWMQSVKVGSDFFKGVTNSWKQLVAVGFLYGVCMGLMRYLRSFFLLTVSSSNSFFWTVASALTICAEVLFTCIALFSMFEITLYNVGTGKVFVDGAVLTFKRLFHTLLMALVSLLPTIVWFVLPWGVLQIVGFCVVAVVGIAYSVTVQTVYCLDVYDTFVNQKQYPDFVRKGLACKSAVNSGNRKNDTEIDKTTTTTDLEVDALQTIKDDAREADVASANTVEIKKEK